jgi:hypothetical protein
MKKTLGLLCCCLLLNACQTDKDNNHAVCEEIKSRMMFNGNDANQSKAFQERNDQGKLSQNYHDAGCL